MVAAMRDDGDDTRSIMGQLLDDSGLNDKAGEEGRARVEGRANVGFNLIHRGRGERG